MKANIFEFDRPIEQQIIDEASCEYQRTFMEPLFFDAAGRPDEDYLNDHETSLYNIASIAKGLSIEPWKLVTQSFRRIGFGTQLRLLRPGNPVHGELLQEVVERQQLFDIAELETITDQLSRVQNCR